MHQVDTTHEQQHLQDSPVCYFNYQVWVVNYCRILCKFIVGDDVLQEFIYG